MLTFPCPAMQIRHHRQGSPSLLAVYPLVLIILPSRGFLLLRALPSSAGFPQKPPTPLRLSRVYIDALVLLVL